MLNTYSNAKLIRVDVRLTTGAILRAISKRELTATEITIHIGCSRPTLDRHMSHLERNGLVKIKRGRGRTPNRYQLTDDGMQYLLER